MADQLLRRSRVADLQRGDLEDFNRTNNSGFGNLALALRYLFAPTFGVVRDGGLVPTDPASLQCVLGPVAAIGPNGTGTGLIIMESDRTVGFTPNASGNPRIDLVSIRFDEQLTSAEARYFQNPDKTWFAANTPTEIVANPIVTVTIGTPDPSPVVPATPVGDLALYAVTILPGATQIFAPNITRLQNDRSDALRFGFGAGANAISLPWASEEILKLRTPALANTLFIASVSLQPGILLDNLPIALQLQDIDSGWVVGSGFAILPPDPVNERHSLFALGVVRGPSGTAPDYSDALRRYRVALVRQDAGTSTLTGPNDVTAFIAALTL